MLTVPLTNAQKIGQHVDRAMELLPVVSDHMAAAESALLHHDAAIINAILAEQGPEITGRQLTSFAILGEAINQVRSLNGLSALVDTRPFHEKLASHGMGLSDSGVVVSLPAEIPQESDSPM